MWPMTRCCTYLILLGARLEPCLFTYLVLPMGTTKPRMEDLTPHDGQSRKKTISSFYVAILFRKTRNCHFYNHPIIIPVCGKTQLIPVCGSCFKWRRLDPLIPICGLRIKGWITGLGSCFTFSTSLCCLCGTSPTLCQWSWSTGSTYRAWISPWKEGY